MVIKVGHACLRKSAEAALALALLHVARICSLLVHIIGLKAFCSKTKHLHSIMVLPAFGISNSVIYFQSTVELPIELVQCQKFIFPQSF